MTSPIGRGARHDAELADDLDRSGSVRVAVLNQPVLTAAAVGTRRAWLQTADVITGIAEGQPGLDLLVLSGHGPWHTGPDHLDVVSDACRAARVWSAIRLGGPSPRMALIDHTGRVVTRHDAARQTGGRLSRTVDGPGGLRTALTFIGSTGSMAADADLRGAELVVALRVHPTVNGAPVHTSTRALAWARTCYVAAANPCGTIDDRHWSGCSLVAGPDGDVLATCMDEECELAVADLSPDHLRRGRLSRLRSGADLRAALRRHRAPARPLDSLTRENH